MPGAAAPPGLRPGRPPVNQKGDFSCRGHCCVLCRFACCPRGSLPPSRGRSKCTAWGRTAARPAGWGISTTTGGSTSSPARTCTWPPTGKPIQVRTLQGSVDEQGNGYMYDFMNAAARRGWRRFAGRGFLLLAREAKRVVSQHGAGGRAVAGNGGRGERQLRTWRSVGHRQRRRGREILPGVVQTVWYEVGKLADGRRGIVVHRCRTSRTLGAWVRAT